MGLMELGSLRAQVPKCPTGCCTVLFRGSLIWPNLLMRQTGDDSSRVAPWVCTQPEPDSRFLDVSAIWLFLSDEAVACEEGGRQGLSGAVTGPGQNRPRFDFYSLEGKWPFLPKALKATGNEGAFCVSEPTRRSLTILPFVATMLTARLSRPLSQLPRKTLNFSDRENGTR